MTEPEPEESGTNELQENMAEPATPTFALMILQENADDETCYTSLDGLKSCNVATKEMSLKFGRDSKNAGMLCEKLTDR